MDHIIICIVIILNRNNGYNIEIEDNFDNENKPNGDYSEIKTKIETGQEFRNETKEQFDKEIKKESESKDNETELLQETKDNEPLYNNDSEIIPGVRLKILNKRHPHRTRLTAYDKFWR